MLPFSRVDTVPSRCRYPNHSPWTGIGKVRVGPFVHALVPSGVLFLAGELIREQGAR